MRRCGSGAAAVALILMPTAALATQGHGDPEGLVVHQMSHIFFMFSMGILIYWLRARDLVRHVGWRYIQYSSVFFILWTLDAFTVHILDEGMGIIQVTRIDPWHLRIESPSGSGWVRVLYYAVKLDHLLCVPGLIFLYLGIKRLLNETRKGEGGPRYEEEIS